ALSLADQVAVMASGRFLQVGSAVEVYLAPEHPAVAAFLGSATLLPGEVGGDGRVDSPLGEVALITPRPAGPVTLVVRAEQVQVSTDATSGTKGVVEEVSFFGHDATIRVRLSDDVRVTARVPGTGIPDIGATVALEVVGPLVGYPGDAP
ncbi:MAG: TOBE domain-containing protein, partial [Nocardioidaceae bacterium]